VVCGEHGNGGDGEYCSDYDAQLNRANVIYHEALGGKYVPRAVLFDFEPACSALCARLRSASPSARETS
jgi:tubulin beta